MLAAGASGSEEKESSMHDSIHWEYELVVPVEDWERFQVDGPTDPEDGEGRPGKGSESGVEHDVEETGSRTREGVPTTASADRVGKDGACRNREPR